MFNLRKIYPFHLKIPGFAKVFFVNIICIYLRHFLAKIMAKNTLAKQVSLSGMSITSIILLLFTMMAAPCLSHGTSVIDVGDTAASEVDGNDINSVEDFITLIANNIACEIGGIASVLVKGEQSQLLRTAVLRHTSCL